MSIMENIKRVVLEEGKLLRYDSESRREFVKEVHAMRRGTKRLDPMTYEVIARILNEHGYRNRNNGEITKQFVGNLLHRHPLKK